MPAQVALLHKVGGGRLGWQQMFLPAVSVFLERPKVRFGLILRSASQVRVQSLELRLFPNGSLSRANLAAHYGAIAVMRLLNLRELP